jgi:hypothetical protein
MDASEIDSNKFEEYKQYILRMVRSSSVIKEPYYHLYIDGVFPAELYTSLKQRMLEYKYGGKLQDRHQDSKQFINSRYSLVENKELEVLYLRALFSDPDIKRAFLEKFYVDANDELVSGLKIHHEFEFMYTKAGRFQNIHVDIPSKFLSFVFYFPENEVDADTADHNGTVVYDKNLKPHHSAKYTDNSLCIFAPHFYSYHGFSSTIDREVLVMFYIHEVEQAKWQALRRTKEDIAPYTLIKNATEDKLIRYPIFEFADEGKIAVEKEACLINAPQGRVMITEAESN